MAAGFTTSELRERGKGSQRKAILGEDDATMVFETSKGVDVTPTFDQMNLAEDLLRGIYAYGMLCWVAPRIVQQYI